MSKSAPQRKTFVLTTGQENYNTETRAHVEQTANFAFRQRTLGLDWRKVAGIDCDDIRDSGNVELLQELIFTITFCNVDAEFAHSSVVDKNLLKLFKTSQLIIEYLIHCQDCLLTTVNKNSHELMALREENASLLEKLTAEKEFNKKAKKECHKRRLLAAQYQAELMALKSGSVPREQFPCPNCPKIFLSSYYLKTHMVKRHNLDISQPTQQAPSTQQHVVVQSVEPVHMVVASKEPASTAAPTVAPTPTDSLQRQELEQLRSYFTREMTEMSEKMAEWQRLAEQLRVQRDVALQNKSSSPTPAPNLQAPTPVLKHSNFGAKLEDDALDQEKRIMDQLGGQLNNQFVSFTSQLDERVLQLSRGIADQLAADSRRHADVLTNQVSELMTQLARERESRHAAERQRDEALVSRQTVTYIQPKPIGQKAAKSTLFKSGSASRSTPSLAQPSAPSPPPPQAATLPQPVEKSPGVPEAKHKKSFLETLSSKFKSPKKATSTPALAQQAAQQQQQEATLQRSATVGQNAAQQQAVSSSRSQASNRPDFFPHSRDNVPALPKMSQQQQQPTAAGHQPFLVALMEDGAVRESDSELTSRPSSTSPQPHLAGTGGTSPGSKWQSVEPVPVAAHGKMQPTPSDTLQQSMTLPSLSATGNLASTGPAVSIVGQAAGASLPMETAGSSMYLSATATSASLQTATASGLVMAALRPRSAEAGDESMTATDLDINVRRQMMELVDREMEKRGINKGEKRLDSDRYAALRAQLENERREREFTHPDFFSNTRHQILSTIDKMAREKAAGGSTFRSEISRTESSYHRVAQPTNTKGAPVVSANATPRGADRSEILPTESQWTSEEDTLELKAPQAAHPRQQSGPIPVVPAHVAAASSAAVVISSTPSSAPNRKGEPPAVMTFSNPSPTAAGSRQQLQPPAARGQAASRNDGATSPSGTTDDVSTLDVTSSIRDHPVRGGASGNDFDETDSEEQMLKKEMARYQIDTSIPEGGISAKRPGYSMTSQSAVPTFGRTGQNVALTGSRPASSLTGISDDFDQDFGP